LHTPDSSQLSLLRFIPGYKKLPIKANIELRDSINNIEQTVNHIIKQKRSSTKVSVYRTVRMSIHTSQKSEQVDLLELLLQASDEENGKLDDTQLRSDVWTFLLAGYFPPMSIHSTY
jgi:cytochrome P450